MNQVNRMREVLRQGKVAVGTCIDSFSPGVVETAGYSGLDFFRIDTEYAWRRDDSLEHMMRAAALAGITPLVRVEKGNPYLISKALQVGAGAILVSDIVSAREALEVVKSAKFAPRGHRGYSTYSPAGGWGTRSGKDWVDWSDEEILVGVMVENQQAVAEIDEILSIHGLDYCLFGPSDYSMSLGYRTTKKDDPKVQEAIRKTVAAATRHNKAVGVGIGQPWVEEAKKYIEMGCRIIEIGHELGVLRSVWAPVASALRGGK